MSQASCCRRSGLWRPTSGAALLLCALGCATFSPRTVRVEGSVTDTLETPVANATVRLTSDDDRRTFASTTSGTDGRFTVSAKIGGRQSFFLVVQKEGYRDWGTSYAQGPRGPERVVLERAIDRAALDALLTLPPPARRRMLVELLKGDTASQVGLLFTYVGRLRPELLAVAGATDPSIETALRDEARFLLALWGDPADADLPRGESIEVADAPADITGARPEEACEAYVVPHFTHEHTPPPYTLHICGEPAFAPDGTRALLEFTVRYANWAYWELLVMVRDGDRWRLRSVVHWGIT